MKTNVLILLVCSTMLFGNQKATARIVTLLLTGTNQTASLVLQENEGAKLAGGYDYYRAEVSSDSRVGYAEVVKTGARMPLFADWYNWQRGIAFSIAGPATITLSSGVTNRTESQSVFLSFEVLPENYDVNKSITIAPGTGGAAISLENSTNLISWVTATNGVYTNVPSATFFRVKAERLP